MSPGYVQWLRLDAVVTATGNDGLTTATTTGFGFGATATATTEVGRSIVAASRSIESSSEENRDSRMSIRSFCSMSIDEARKTL